MHNQQTASITLTVDVAIMRTHNQGVEILLIKRKNDPYKGLWALPGGKLNSDDVSLEEAARREIWEETALVLGELTQVATFGDVGRDPRGRYISVLYRSLIRLVQSSLFQAGDDAEEAAWFSYKQLPSLAFDHACLVKAALNDLVPGLATIR